MERIGSDSHPRFIPWRKPPQRRRGVFKGKREGKFGPLADLLTDKGLISVSLPKYLEEKIDKLTVGDLVVIDYTRDKTSQRGFEYRSFDVGREKTAAEMETNPTWPEEPPYSWLMEDRSDEEPLDEEG